MPASQPDRRQKGPEIANLFGYIFRKYFQFSHYVPFMSLSNNVISKEIEMCKDRLGFLQ